MRYKKKTDLSYEYAYEQLLNEKHNERGTYNDLNVKSFVFFLEKFFAFSAGNQ